MHCVNLSIKKYVLQSGSPDSVGSISITPGSKLKKSESLPADAHQP